MAAFDRGASSSADGPRTLTTGLLLVLGMLMTTNPLATTMYLPALGQVAEGLDTSIAGAQLVFTGFLLGVAFGQLLVGMLSDSLGRRRVLLAGLGLLTLAAFVSSAAPTLELLVVARVVQGLGAAASVVISRAIVSDLARGPQAARAYSILMGMLAAGPFVAPLLGTALLQLGGWRAIFIGLGVVSALYLGAAFLAVPETLAPALRSPVRPRPLVGNYVRLLRDRAYLANALAMAFGFAALSVHSSASSFVSQEILGTGVWGFTLIYMLYAVAIMGGSMANAVVSARFGAPRMMLVSQTVALIAAVVLVVFAVWGPFTVWTFVPTVLIGGAAASAVLANASTLTLARAGFAAASGAALMGFLQFLVAAAASPVGGVLGPGTAVPMAVGMLGCLIASASSAWIGRTARGPEPQPRATPRPGPLPGLPDPV